MPVLGSALLLAAALFAPADLTRASTVGFGATNVVGRFVSRSVNLDLPGAPGYEENFSGCCVNPATEELLVVLRGPGLSDYAIQGYTPDGALTRFIALTGFNDVEAICSVNPASNRFAVVEEGINQITLITVASNTTTIAKSSGRVINMNLGNLLNAGIEGLTWDAGRQCFYAVKEWQPARILRITETSGVAVTETLFEAALITNLCVDLSDIHYDALSDRLLILSHESHRVLECDLTGRIFGLLPIQLTQPEGIVLETARTELFVIGEPNHYQRFAAHWQTRPEDDPFLLPLLLTDPPDPAVTAAVQVAIIGAAPAGHRFDPASALATFTTGPSATVTLTVPDNGTFTPPRDFLVALTNPENATLTDDRVAVLRVYDPGAFHWTLNTLPGIGQPFLATLAARAANSQPQSNYTGPAALSLTREALLPATLLPSNPPLFAITISNFTTRGLRFTITNAVVVTHLRYTFGDLAALWTDAGDLLAFAAGPTADGDWQEVTLTNPVPLAAGSTYRIGASSFARIPRVYVTALPLPATVSRGIILSGCQTNTTGFPALFSGSSTAVDFRGEGLDRIPDHVSPTGTASFVAGQWSGWLTITAAMENVVLQATTATGQSGLSAPFDLELRPRVDLFLPPEVEEGAGLLPGAGQVTIAFDPTEERLVHVVSADTNLLVLPATVTITGGTDSANFDLFVPENTDLGNPPAVFVYATATGHAAGTNAVTVLDDESTRLALEGPTNALPENAGTVTNACRVSIPAPLTVDLMVQLTASDSERLAVPPSVIIPADQTFTAFDLTILNNPNADGPRHVSLGATAAGFSAASITIRIMDDEPPSGVLLRVTMHTPAAPRSRPE